MGHNLGMPTLPPSRPTPGWRGKTLVAVAVALLLSGCIGTTGRDSFEAEIAARGGGSPERVWQEVAADLERRLGTDDFAVMDLSLTPNNRFAMVELRDPSAPGNVDRYYYYNGEMDRSEPVRLSVSDDLEAGSFSILAVRMDRLDEMADEALAEYGAEGRTVERVSIRRSSTGGDHVPLLTFSLTSPRSSARATFDGQGRFLGLEML